MNKESENAKAVAKEVIETVRMGKKVNFQEIQKNHGYSDSSARAMKAKEAKSYKKEMFPIVEQMIKERDRAIKAMTTKDLDKVAYEKLSSVIDQLTKNAQLLSGKETENININTNDKETANEAINNYIANLNGKDNPTDIQDGNS